MSPESTTRRRVLAGAGSLAAVGASGCGFLPTEQDTTATQLEGEQRDALAREYAPTLYFDRRERWYPTDPSPYAVDRDGERVVDGFAALDGYTDRWSGPDSPPAPVIYTNAVRYEGTSLGAVQFWSYSVFDQFTTNFHWHDWEVLHVFVDLDSGSPQLYVASSHSRSVPNNEYLDPERRPRVLPELGSHSSGLSVNDIPDRFQRLPVSGTVADITNRALSGLDAVREIPLAYGLPRDEGSRLPFAVPELDGAPLYEHERLPSVDRSDLLDEAVTVRSFDELLSPPEALPTRETGVRWEHENRSDTGDVRYELRPIDEIEDIDSFDGPQLSFEFAVPQFAEDAIASHITTAGVPWTQSRFDNPALDITEPTHRNALAERYDAIGAVGTPSAIVAAITRTVSDADAPDGAGVTTESSPVEAIALVESEAHAVPTFREIAVAQGLPTGEHRLTVNRAGAAPHSERVTVETEGPTAAGVDGEIPLVANEHSVKLRVDPRESEVTISRLAVEDDFGGRLLDAPIDGPDAVYLHWSGAYTAEVRDTDGDFGAYRVVPADPEDSRLNAPTTGVGSLASYLGSLAQETRTDVASVASDGGSGGDGGPIRGLARALGAVGDAATHAATAANEGDRARAEDQLATVGTRLETVAERLEDARSELPPEWTRAMLARSDSFERRLQQAQAAGRL